MYLEVVADNSTALSSEWVMVTLAPGTVMYSASGTASMHILSSPAVSRSFRDTGISSRACFPTRFVPTDPVFRVCNRAFLRVWVLFQSVATASVSLGRSATTSNAPRDVPSTVQGSLRAAPLV